MDKTTTLSSENKSEGGGREGCMPCRILGGIGLSGAGIYVASQISKQGKLPSKLFVAAFAGGNMK